MTNQEKPILFFDDDSTALSPIDDKVEEKAIITIEEDKKDTPNNSKKHKWLWMATCVVASLVVCTLCYAGWRAYNYYYNIGVPVSVSPDENIQKLAMPHKKGKPSIILTSDSILGVALNMYRLENLQAEITLTEPDSTDKSVWMYSRCADHTSDGKYLGSMVMRGKELASDASRLGYCAMANGNIVLGVSRSDKVKDYVEERGGSFFRQFILVSNGVLPPKFQLHGKVERRALARTSDDHLYYIETRHPETLWDFADALREYGFVDAIYITGGKCYSYYRSTDGKLNAIGDSTEHVQQQYKNIVPWIVFKAR